LADSLDRATGRLLETGKSPSRKVRELDNRGSHFYLALYWAEDLAAQKDDVDLQKIFRELSQKLRDNEQLIVEELIACQGKSVDIGGYYQLDAVKVEKAMRPSETLNTLLSNVS